MTRTPGHFYFHTSYSATRGNSFLYWVNQAQAYVEI
jgi:hypothetical protein